jgi:prepilin-type N-terminal cleavage/methylation domain-containing protein
MKRFNRNEDGFTLVELLVAMALLSLMAIYAIQTFSTLRSMNRLEADISAQMEVDAVARHLRSEIADARAVFIQGSGPNAKLAFEGTASSLTYVTASNGERETGGLYLVKLSLGSDGVLKSARQLLGSQLSESVEEVILLRGVKAIAFTYIKPGNPPETLENWNIDNQLPAAIGANVTFDTNDLRQWQALLVRVLTAG